MAVDADTEQPVGQLAEVAEEPILKSATTVRLAAVALTAAAIALAALASYLVHQIDVERNAQHVDEMFVQVGRQAATNLSTIDYNSVDGDVQRILDSSTGTFYDDFSVRADAFRDAVRKARSTSEGTVTAAGLESVDGEHAQVVVTLQVKTIVAGAEDSQPRAWRMRLTVQRIGDTAKVGNVEFVS